jgi:hypothetical protein
VANRFRIANALVRRLQDLGVSPQAVLRHAGLPVTLLDQDKAYV